MQGYEAIKQIQPATLRIQVSNNGIFHATFHWVLGLYAVDRQRQKKLFKLFPTAFIRPQWSLHTCNSDCCCTHQFCYIVNSWESVIVPEGIKTKTRNGCPTPLTPPPPFFRVTTPNLAIYSAGKNVRL